MSEKPVCYQCNNHECILLRRNITRHNTNQFFWWCGNCQFFAAGVNYIPNEIIKEWQRAKRLPEDLSLIPLINDYRDGNQCSVLGCDDTEVEYHHLIKDGFEWPSFYLCQEHHRIWSSQ